MALQKMAVVCGIVYHMWSRDIPAVAGVNQVQGMALDRLVLGKETHILGLEVVAEYGARTAHLGDNLVVGANSQNSLARGRTDQQ